MIYIVPYCVTDRNCNSVLTLVLLIKRHQIVNIYMRASIAVAIDKFNNEKKKSCLLLLSEKKNEQERNWQ